MPPNFYDPKRRRGRPKSASKRGSAPAEGGSNDDATSQHAEHLATLIPHRDCWLCRREASR